MKVFIDDLELALENKHLERLELASKDEPQSASEHIETYVRQKFKIWINGEEKIYNYLGKEYENHEVFFYLEIENVDHIKTIQVQNSMLCEAFQDQQNFVKLTIGKVQKTFILVKANDKEMLKL